MNFTLQSRRRMVPHLLLILVLLAAGVVLIAVTAYLMARGLVRPPRMTDGKALHVLGRLTPHDVGLAYEPVSFQVQDDISKAKLRLAGWHIPAAGTSDCTVLLVHGYADAKVGALAWAPVWHELGFHILAIDLRAHGESDGNQCTGGFAERHDLVEVLRDWTAREPEKTQTLMLFGVSLGAAAVAGAAALMTASPDEPKLAGIVLESPFANFTAASRAHMDFVGLPGGRVADLALWTAEKLTHADFNAVRPVDLIPQIRCPILVLSAGDDLYVSESDASALENAVKRQSKTVPSSKFLRFEGIEHLMAVIDEPIRYREVLETFVDDTKRSDSVRSPIDSEDLA